MDLITLLNQLPPSLTAFLTFIATPTVLGPVLSELLEYLPAFQSLTSAKKTLVLYALMVLVGLVSFGIVRWVPTSALEALQPIYSIMIGAAVFFGSSQLFHAKAHGATADTSSSTEIKTAGISVKTETSSGVANNTLSSAPTKPAEAGQIG
jgi:hypothetical protein